MLLLMKQQRMVNPIKHRRRIHLTGIRQVRQYAIRSKTLLKLGPLLGSIFEPSSIDFLVQGLPNQVTAQDLFDQDQTGKTEYNKAQETTDVGARFALRKGI